MRRREFLAGAAGLLRCGLRAARWRWPMCRRPIRSTSTRRWTAARSSSPGASPSAARIPSSSASGSTGSRRMVRNEDLLNDRHKRAFLLTPREKFVLQQNHGRAYDHAFLDIGYGVTISGPHIVGRMTSNIDPKQGEKVLEVGTGSGYQSAYLSHLTDKVYSIEIIKPLAERTRGIYDALDQGRLQRVRRHHVQGRRRLLRLGRVRRRSTRSSSPAASTMCRRRSCSS